MALFLSQLTLVILATLMHHGTSQISNSITPLWPCYSVFKVLPTGNATAVGNNTNTMTASYRYVSRFATTGSDVYDPDNPDCIFTLEGPPNSLLEVQLSNVLIQRPGYVSTSQQDMGNCSVGAIRIYNFTTTGALVQVSEVCSSFLTGNPIMSDTNVVAVTTTIARGNFDIRVTIIPLNSTGRNDNLFRNLPARDGNIILLGHTEQETNLLSDFVNRSPEQEEQTFNNSEVSKLENDEYFEEYLYDDDDDVNIVNNKKNSNFQRINHNVANQIKKGPNNQNKIFNDISPNKNNQFTQQNKNKMRINSKKRPGQKNGNNIFNADENEMDNNPQLQNSESNKPSINPMALQREQLNELFSAPLKNKFSQHDMPEMLPLVKLFLQERENMNTVSSQNQPDTNILISQLIQQIKALVSQNQLSNQMTGEHTLLSLIRNQLSDAEHNKQMLASDNLPIQQFKNQQINDKPVQGSQLISPVTKIMDQSEKMNLFLNQLTQAASNPIPLKQKLSILQPIIASVNSEQMNTQSGMESSLSSIQMSKPTDEVMNQLTALILMKKIEDVAKSEEVHKGDIQEIHKKENPSILNNVANSNNENKSGIFNFMNLIRNQATEQHVEVNNGGNNEKGENKNITENATLSEKVFPQNDENKHEFSHRENSKFAEKHLNTILTPTTNLSTTPSTNVNQAIPTPIPRHVPFLDSNLDPLHFNPKTNMIFKDSDYKF